MVVEQAELAFRNLEIDRGDPQPNFMQLLAIPTISDVLFKHNGLSERQTLRGVSRSFAEFIQNQPLKLTELKISLVDNLLLVELDLQLKYMVSFAWGTCRINRGRGDVESKVKFEKLIVKDLKLIFKHNNTTINQFSLMYSRTETDELPLPDTNLRLKVKQFRIFATTIEQVRSGLTILDPKSVDEIWIDTLNIKCIQSPDIVAHWKLQWKKANVLISKMRFRTNKFVENFGHFNYVHFVVENTRISLGVLEKLKNTLLLRPKLQKFEIVPSPEHYPLDPLFIIPPESFKPYQDPHNQFKFIFPYLNSADVLTLEISYDGVFFTGPAYSGDKDVRKEDPRQPDRLELTERYPMYSEQPYLFRSRRLSFDFLQP